MANAKLILMVPGSVDVMMAGMELIAVLLLNRIVMMIGIMTKVKFNYKFNISYNKVG
jgi:hypothetical protein